MRYDWAKLRANPDNRPEIEALLEAGARLAAAARVCFEHVSEPGRSWASFGNPIAPQFWFDQIREAVRRAPDTVVDHDRVQSIVSEFRAAGGIIVDANAERTGDVQVFETYEAAERHARASANAIGVSFGIERRADTWAVMMIPRPENRYGWERNCEAIEPEHSTETGDT